MALPVARVSRLDALWTLVQPFPGRDQQMVRLASIATLTCLFAEVWGLPEPALAVYVAFFMWKPDRVLSIVLALALMVIAALLIGIVMLLAMVVLDNPMLRVATIVIVAFGVSWLGAASRLKPIAPIMAFVIAFALDLLGSIPIPIFATKALLWAWLLVGVPALVTIIVSLLLAPSPRKLLTAELANRLRAAAAALRQDPDGRARLCAIRAAGHVEVALLMKLARLERTSDPHDLDAIDGARNATTAISLAADCATRQSDAALPTPVAAQIAAHLEAMAAVLDTGAYPVKTALDIASAGLSPAASAVQTELLDAIAAFATDGPHPSAKKPADGFFEADALTNPDYVHFALKVTGAAMICYLLYHLLDWPGIHTAFLTCFIVALPTAAETLEKLGLRLLGAIIGGGVGMLALIFILPSMESAGALLILVFLATLPAAWLAVGSERFSYVGFQWAFAFYLTVIQGSGPAFDLTIARDRIIGILLGNLVTAFMFTKLWPATIVPLVDNGFKEGMRLLSALSATTGRVERSVTAAAAENALSAARTDLAIAYYEPPALVGDDSWNGHRHALLAQLSDLVPMLHLATGMDPAEATRMRAQLAGLESDMDMPAKTSARQASQGALANG